MNVLQNVQMFGWGYEIPTELPEVPGIVARASKTYKIPGRYTKTVPVPRVFVQV